ncbi:MAG: hypothetical protein AAB481_02735 [Patescibacteria group bacterium]
MKFVKSFLIVMVVLVLSSVVWNSLVLGKFQEAGPYWVKDGDLISEAYSNYYYSSGNLDMLASSDGNIFMFEEYFNKDTKWYECLARLEGGDKWTMYLTPLPSEALVECFHWVRAIKPIMYEGGITHDDGQKILRMQRNWQFIPDRIVIRYP